MSIRRAILVGLKEVAPQAYGGWDGKNGCAGCEFDVDNVAQMLTPMGYEILTLKTAEATKLNILSYLNDSARTLEAGDTLLFYYAGHGGQQPDRNGDESDGHDETLIAFDGEIIDDQLNEIWCSFKPGVRIIMLSDSCNSGTNYRDLNRIPEPTPIKPVDDGISDEMVAQMVHMGGCRDGAVSAGYQSGGAFTIALVNAWNGGQFQGTYEDLHATILQGVNSGQEPQMNWYGNITDDFRNEPVFGSSNGQVLSISKAKVEPQMNVPHNSSQISGENQRLLIEAYLKLLDTIGAAEAPRVRAAGDRRLVCVHGISTHEERYSDRWWAGLKPYTSIFGSGRLGETRFEVLWSNLVNSRDVRDRQAHTELKLRIQDVLDDRQRQQVAPVAESVGNRNLPQDRARDFSWDDFIVYMTNPSVRQRIIDRFTQVVGRLLADGSHIDIIAHSWGTVVAYEGLRELESDSSLTGEVGNLFTVGSALSIPPVRGSLLTANRDGRRPNMVRHWVNLDAQGDLVGGSLIDKFEVDVEKLNLVPAGCDRNLGGLGWYGLGCAHSSYFSKDNEEVNRNIFGHYINQ